MATSQVEENLWIELHLKIDLVLYLAYVVGMGNIHTDIYIYISFLNKKNNRSHQNNKFIFMLLKSIDINQSSKN